MTRNLKQPGTPSAWLSLEMAPQHRRWWKRIISKSRRRAARREIEGR